MSEYEVMLHASGLGIVSPEAAVKLMDWNEIEYDDSGKPKNVDAALKSLLKSYPFLSKQDSEIARGGHAGSEAAHAGQPATGTGNAAGADVLGV